MEKIMKRIPIRLPAMPKLRRTPLMEDAAAFAILGGGGYIALRLMGLLFHALGVD